MMTKLMRASDGSAADEETYDEHLPLPCMANVDAREHTDAEEWRAEKPKELAGRCRLG
jgi:hypothetical protein